MSVSLSELKERVSRLKGSPSELKERASRLKESPSESKREASRLNKLPRKLQMFNSLKYRTRWIVKTFKEAIL